MEKLLAMAKKAADQAEVYSLDTTFSRVTFQDAKLHNIETEYQSGVSLRIIKDGKLGFSYVRNLKNRQELLDNALQSLNGGLEAGFELSDNLQKRELITYDAAIESAASDKALAEAKRICEELSAQTNGEIMAGAYFSVETLRVLNSEGADLIQRSSTAGSYCDAIYPGSGSGIGRHYTGKKPGPMPSHLIDEIVNIYNKGEKIIEPQSGRMKVLFMPDSMITLLWRLTSGLNGRQVYEKVSPVANKIGRNIFSPALTIIDDPLNDKYPGARAWDDEGVACQPLKMVDRGNLKAFYFDLKYAQKMGAVSTGHGYRNGFRGGDPITRNPEPYSGHLFIEPGQSSLQDLISSMDRGIIIEGALGAHSGNIPNGDYSIGISPGFYVEKGEVIGRVKDAMAAGNIYETLTQVAGVGNLLYPSFGGAWVPPLLCEGVSITTKK
jgi:PmbA protein